MAASARCRGVVSALLFLLMALLSGPAPAGQAIAPGERFPSITLSTWDSPRVRKYLGLDNASAFSMSQIRAKIVVVEFFSLYCTVCQKQAPMANRIYKAIEGDETLAEDVKMIGIGVGNNQTEIGFFKTHYRVPFPLCPDPHFDIHRKLGEPRTPFTMAVTNEGRVLMTHQGIVKDLSGFLDQIRRFHKDL